MPEAEKVTGRLVCLRKPLFWTAIVIITPLAIMAVMWLPGRWELQEELSRLREAGFPTNGAELDAFYRVPEGMVDTTELWVSALEAANTKRFIERRQRFLLSARERNRSMVKNGTTLLPLERFYLNLEQVFAAIHVAAEAGGMARFPEDYSDTTHAAIENTQAPRTVARLLTLDAPHVSLRDGDNARVLRDLIAVFALSDATSNQPLLLSHQVRIAIHSIGVSHVQSFMTQGQWNDAQLATLQHAIATASFKKEMQLALCGERVVALSAFDHAPLSVLYQSQKLQILQVYAKLNDVFQASWPEVIQEVTKIDGEIQGRESETIVKLITPLVNKTIQTSARAMARQRGIVTAIAVQRYQFLNRNFPKSLAEIPAELFPDMHTKSEASDPFSGEPLRYLNNDSECVVYSVGINGSDDGGKVEFEGGKYPDIGFRLTR